MPSAVLVAVACAAPRLSLAADPLENVVLLDLKDGRVTILLRPDLAPKHVERVKAGRDLHSEAVPWLERALEARRYEPRHFPYYNLGRIYQAREMYAKARESFQQALRLDR